MDIELEHLFSNLAALPQGPYLSTVRRDGYQNIIEVCTPMPDSPWVLQHHATLAPGDDAEPQALGAIVALLCNAPAMLDVLVQAVQNCQRCSGSGVDPNSGQCTACRAFRTVLKALDASLSPDEPQPVRAGYTEVGAGVDLRTGIDAEMWLSQQLRHLTAQLANVVGNQVMDGALQLILRWERMLPSEPRPNVKAVFEERGGDGTLYQIAQGEPKDDD